MASKPLDHKCTRFRICTPETASTPLDHKCTRFRTDTPETASTPLDLKCIQFQTDPRMKCVSNSSPDIYTPNSTAARKNWRRWPSPVTHVQSVRQQGRTREHGHSPVTHQTLTAARKNCRRWPQSSYTPNSYCSKEELQNMATVQLHTKLLL